MILDVTFKSIAYPTYIDFIELELENGQIVTLDWAESEYSTAQELNSLCEISATFYGVSFNANGKDLKWEKLEDIPSFKIATVQIFNPDNQLDPKTFKILDLAFDDDGGIYWGSTVNDNFEVICEWDH